MKKTQTSTTIKENNKINICVLLYPEFACHGISLLMYLLNQTNKCNLYFVGETNNPIRSKEGMLFKVDYLISQINFDSFDALIIPGGTPECLDDIKELPYILHEFNNGRKLIAAICAAGIQLAKNGLLTNTKYTNSNNFNSYISRESNFPQNKLVVCDKNIITARGKGFVDFAMEVIKYLQIESEKRIEYLLARYKPLTLDIEW